MRAARIAALRAMRNVWRPRQESTRSATARPFVMYADSVVTTTNRAPSSADIGARVDLTRPTPFDSIMVKTFKIGERCGDVFVDIDAIGFQGRCARFPVSKSTTSPARLKGQGRASHTVHQWPGKVIHTFEICSESCRQLYYAFEASLTIIRPRRRCRELRAACRADQTIRLDWLRGGGRAHLAAVSTGAAR